VFTLAELFIVESCCAPKEFFIKISIKTHGIDGGWISMI
jgi:hypothetical protein